MTTRTLSIGPEPEIEIELIGGDLLVAGWERNEIAIDGDDLDEMEQNGESVSISCGGDLKLSVPRGAELVIGHVGGGLKMENLTSSIELSLVGGDVLLRNLSGNITLTGSVGGETKMENVSKISMNAGRGVPVGDISEKVRRKVEAATRRAEKKIRVAEHKIRRAEFIAVERKVRRGIPPIPPIPPISDRESKSRRWNFGFDTSGAPEASQRVSDEERLTILKMLQEKKITSEEADRLLAALEGGS